MMVFMVSRVKQSLWKGFRSMEPDLESFWMWLENWIRKVKKKMMELVEVIRIDAYFST